MTAYIDIEHKIDDTVELSSICRGEWCRALESDMDDLDSQLNDFIKSGEVNEPLCYETVSRKIREGYRNLSPDIHV